MTRFLPGDGLARLREVADADVWPGGGPPAPEVLRRSAAACQGLLCLLTETVDSALLEDLPGLCAVSSYSVGLDHVDLEAATRLGVPVGNTPGVLTETTADLAFALLLAAARRIPEADSMVRSGLWTQERSWAPDLMVGRDLHGATLGIIGLGAIGQAVARRATGFGMRVLGWSRSGRRVPGVEGTSLDPLLGTAEFVSVHLALTPETRGLIGAEALGRMRPGSILVNTARGGIVDEAALARALREGRLGGAGLDVFEHEPLAADERAARRSQPGAGAPHRERLASDASAHGRPRLRQPSGRPRRRAHAPLRQPRRLRAGWPLAPPVGFGLLDRACRTAPGSRAVKPPTRRRDGHGRRGCDRP